MAQAGLVVILGSRADCVLAVDDCVWGTTAGAGGVAAAGGTHVRLMAHCSVFDLSRRAVEGCSEVALHKVDGSTSVWQAEYCAGERKEGVDCTCRCDSAREGGLAEGVADGASGGQSIEVVSGGGSSGKLGHLRGQLQVSTESQA